MLDVLRSAYISETTSNDTITLLSSECNAKVHFNLVLSMADFETALMQARRENPVWEILLMSLYKTSDSSAAQNALLRDSNFMQMFLEKQTEYIEDKMKDKEEQVVSCDNTVITEQVSSEDDFSITDTDSVETSFDASDIFAMAAGDTSSGSFTQGDPFADSLECVASSEDIPTLSEPSVSSAGSESATEPESESEFTTESDPKSEFEQEPNQATTNKNDSELKQTLITVFETAENLAKDSNVFMAVRDKVSEYNLLESFVNAYEVALQECSTKEERHSLLVEVLKVMMLDPRTASASFVQLTKSISLRLIDKYPTLAEDAVMPLVNAIYTGTENE